tara:strand:- start:17519 stop:17674 length:156 start_codon:yes stop_codon:yes gene_type:complete
MNTATVIKNKHGDFEVVVNDVRVKGGYFSRMEDYANTEANKMARIINTTNN